MSSTHWTSLVACACRHYDRPMSDLLKLLPVVPDFPKLGVSFRDISPLLADPQAFAQAIAGLRTLSASWPFDYLLGIEARGLVFAAALAQACGVGLVLARKPNKLPTATFSESYGLEYGTDMLQIQQSLLPRGARVLLVDDILATGGSIGAAAGLVQQAGAVVSGALVLLEITELNGRAALAGRSVAVQSLLQV